MTGLLLPPQLLRDVFARRPAAVRELVRLLHPVVRARVARVVLRVRGGRGTAPQEVDDLTQETFSALFENDARRLRAWEPERGLSLENFAGLVAERTAISFLRSARRSGDKEDPTLSEVLDLAHEPAASPEAILFSRDLLERLLDALRLELSPLGMHLFDLIYVQDKSVEEVAGIAKMTAEAIYAWRSRLRKVVARLGLELLPELADVAPQSREVRRDG